MSNDGRIGRLRAAGTPREIGLTLGRRSRAAVHERLVHTAAWRICAAQARGPALVAMHGWVAAHYRGILSEIEGLAEGLDLPFHEVFAWNCRGEISAAPDGCTTVMLPGPRPCLGHNEDGLPELDGHCFLAEVLPEGEPGFCAFCYPGSLPGHTFAVTGAGLVQTVNNLRLHVRDPQAPRMVLGRAVLAAPDIDAALAVLQAAPAGAGFHFALAQAGEDGIHSVEFGAGHVTPRQVTAPEVHANHALFHPLARTDQRVTESSRDRQDRGAALLKQGARAPLDILHDEAGPGLPVYRDAPDDPDNENTLATAIFEIGAEDVNWWVYPGRGAEPSHARTVRRC